MPARFKCEDARLALAATLRLGSLCKKERGRYQLEGNAGGASDLLIQSRIQGTSAAPIEKNNARRSGPAPRRE